MTDFTTALNQAQDAFGPGSASAAKDFAGLLYLHRFDFRQDPLIALGKRYRLPSPGEDMGYLVHAGLTALFGQLLPRTFCITHRNRGIVQVLAYSEHSLESMRDHASIYATPEALATCELSTISSKQMPARWKTGMILGFRLRACPTERLKEARNNHRKGAEVDSFLVAQWEDPAADRNQVYLSWLANEVAPSARILQGRLESFRLESVIRRTHDTEHRAKQGLRKPSAIYEGALEVVDGNLFGAALARGFGRHKAFGFGMLLLQPWRG